MNKLPIDGLLSLGLISVVTVPTHKGNFLDRIFCNVPIYNNVKAVATLIKTTHSMVIACPDNRTITDVHKTRRINSTRPRTPSQDHKALSLIADMNWADVYGALDGAAYSRNRVHPKQADWYRRDKGFCISALLVVDNHGVIIRVTFFKGHNNDQGMYNQSEGMFAFKSCR